MSHVLYSQVLYSNKFYCLSLVLYSHVVYSNISTVCLVFNILNFHIILRLLCYVGKISIASFLCVVFTAGQIHRLRDCKFISLCCQGFIQWVNWGHMLIRCVYCKNAVKRFWPRSVHVRFVGGYLEERKARKSPRICEIVSWVLPSYQREMCTSLEICQDRISTRLSTARRTGTSLM